MLLFYSASFITSSTINGFGNPDAVTFSATPFKYWLFPPTLDIWAQAKDRLSAKKFQFANHLIFNHTTNIDINNSKLFVDILIIIIFFNSI